MTEPKLDPAIVKELVPEMLIRVLLEHDQMLEMLKFMVHWHDQLSPADIKRAEALIARVDAP
jgi:hypothetical protein